MLLMVNCVLYGFLKIIYLFIGCVGSSLRCLGFSPWQLLLLQGLGSRIRGLHSYSAPTWLPCGVWDLPGPGIESKSPALADRFLTTGPSGKPLYVFLKAKNKGGGKVNTGATSHQM